MTARRTLLSLVAGATALLAGRGRSDEPTDSVVGTPDIPATGTPDTPTTDSLGVTAADVLGTPGEHIGIDVTATHVAVLTYGVSDIPDDWLVTHGGFSPEPTAVRESYAPELVWDPAVESVRGMLTVAVANDASSGEYELPAEVRTEDREENAVATATLPSMGNQISGCSTWRSQNAGCVYLA